MSWVVEIFDTNSGKRDFALILGPGLSDLIREIDGSLFKGVVYRPHDNPKIWRAERWDEARRTHVLVGDSPSIVKAVRILTGR